MLKVISLPCLTHFNSSWKLNKKKKSNLRQVQEVKTTGMRNIRKKIRNDLVLNMFNNWEEEEELSAKVAEKISCVVKKINWGYRNRDGGGGQVLKSRIRVGRPISTKESV